ncbi:helix-turn-helix transcriptional regulator [Cupriavidus oxalaticus]|uniref:Uncharacterized protein n=1 Tax=Cupriavidus oxalaticus TaxID=96344 RepID=A0ABX7HJG1_9BURK|nr:hypothetical protein [Cupriavidus oxalaticus]QRQ85337.1 hypothetical protein JTE91_04480 [Cupriavidus oxalaticus]QRQ90575.1 hypothetical protein JTE92_07865 [Cupriavidus oxalaticus]WQD85096.1 hypothetical protein U0036_25990 [Cupriavidus oxalaticus]
MTCSYPTTNCVPAGDAKPSIEFPADHAGRTVVVAPLRISEPTLYAGMKAGTLPQSVKLGPNGNCQIEIVLHNEENE